MSLSIRIEELKCLIKKANDNYYNLSGDIVSDQEYDAWVRELSELSPNNEEVLSIGAAPPPHSIWEKVKHSIPMGSLNKANSEKEMDDWVSKDTTADDWFITHKIDGSSMELVYEFGKLIRCVSRGDGIIGEDITLNVSKVPSVPKLLQSKVNATVRGEIVMTKNMFITKYASEYANPRNTAAGKIREKKGGGESCQDLEFLAYWLHLEDQNDEPETMSSVMNWLDKNGFKVPEHSSGSYEMIKTVYDNTAMDRKSIPYEIDGMVISFNNIKSLNELGIVNGRPKGQIAWKFDPAMGETKIREIKWQVGPSGRITPVAVVEPVSIGGVTITNISLHNLSIFHDLHLHQGNRVLVSRRNDVIPFLERNLDIDM
jgi:DNA ligase (NAD+)